MDKELLHWIVGYLYMNGEVGKAESLRTIINEFESNTKYSLFNRLEVIDHNGRSYVNNNCSNIEMSVQDNGKTLKIFAGKGS